MEKRDVKKEYDVSIIRPQMRSDDVRIRGEGLSSEKLRAIRKGLLTLHTLETMAVDIYRYQITAEISEHNRELIAAMCNEMTHLQDFQIKLFEYGWRPSIKRWDTGLWDLSSDSSQDSGEEDYLEDGHLG